jgi:sugar lactone lactonase YvrE
MLRSRHPLLVFTLGCLLAGCQHVAPTVLSLGLEAVDAAPGTITRIAEAPHPSPTPVTSVEVDVPVPSATPTPWHPGGVVYSMPTFPVVLATDPPPTSLTVGLAWQLTRAVDGLLDVGGMAKAPDGTLYVTDPASNRLLAAPSDTSWVRLAGSSLGTAGFLGDGGAGTLARLAAPHGVIHEDGLGVVLFCDTGNGRIRYVWPDGTIGTYAGGGADAGDAVAAKDQAALAEPWGLVAGPDDSLYFTERASGRVRRIAPDGSVSTLATLTQPGPIALDATNGVLWVGDGPDVKTLPVGGGAVTTAFSAPGKLITGLAADQAGHLWAMQASADGRSGAKVWRLQVGTDGLANGITEVVAGTGAAVAAAADAMVGGAPEAARRALAGSASCALAIDLTQAGSSSTRGGQVYVGNGFGGTAAQVLRLELGGP